MDQPDANGDRPPGARLTGDRTIDTTATMNDQDASLLDLDYASAFPEALDSRNMDMTARCLFAALRADDLVWLRNIDQATFSTVLEVMEPANTIDRLAAAHRDISQAMLGQLGIMSMQTIAWQYTDLLTEILRIRTDATSKNPSGVSSADTSLTLRDYNTLLRSARDLGDRDFAALLWTRLHESWLRPDVNSWNYYMAAAVLHKQHDEMSRFNHRVTPFFQMCRRVAQPGRMFQSYRTGQNSVGDHVVKCFREMLQQGVAANEESYLVVITAAAREGDLDVVKSVLRRVWGVDVDAVMADAEEAESSTTTDEESLGTKALPKDSPAYPTAKLLFTVADAFSKNNTLPTALRLVDHLSRAYDIPIRDETWSLLFEWTFILAIPRGHTSKHFSEGKLPIQAVLSLWDTMVAAPYHVQPTMGMYDRLIKNLTSRQMIPLVLDKMQEGLRLYNISRLQTRALWRRLVKALYRRRHLRKGKKSDPKAASLEALRADWEIADLHRARNLIRVKRWLRLMLQTLRRSGYVDNGMYSGELSLRVIPRTLLEWRDFAPTRTRYEVEGGILEIKIRTEEEMDAKAEVRVQKGEMYMETLQKVKRLVGHAWLGAHRVRVPRRLLDFDNKRGGRSKTKPTA
ncbi:hypothetical protein B0A50_07589 [Salinomyces thailandicus]|uniref:Pentatricopeptide repeat domain-containing protein n=1 Tax=Salinomyces thailandicus TaxID=706561 RepID=A0A4U0TN25_9PEZI|nr:hypothetical protein B0A50_07589 [Salinomyces thailandica]